MQYRTPLGKVNIIKNPGQSDGFSWKTGPSADWPGQKVGAINFLLSAGVVHDIREATAWLQSQSLSATALNPSEPQPTNEAKRFKPPPRIRDHLVERRNVTEYLHHHRGISPSVIDFAMRHGDLYAGFGDWYGGYVVFPMRDANGHMTGAIMRWMRDEPPTKFGGQNGPMVPGTQTDKGWWSLGSGPLGVVVEAPIDALSIASVLPDQWDHLITLLASGGSADIPLVAFERITHVLGAQDADGAGERQFNRLAGRLKDKPTGRLKPPQGKDWNECWQTDPDRMRDLWQHVLNRWQHHQTEGRTKDVDRER